MATSTLQEDGSYLREYPRGRMAAHVTGYSSVGKTGVEAAYNFELMSVHQELLQRLSGLMEGKDPKGNDVVLTLDMDIQSAAGDLLGSTKGAVVVMEPSTGRILAMQAYPDFDPNTVSGDWDYLTTDEDSPLVNRATQGLYPPGSTFKIITALAAMECVPDWQSFTYDCRGEAEFENKVTIATIIKPMARWIWKKAWRNLQLLLCGPCGKNRGRKPEQSYEGMRHSF